MSDHRGGYRGPVSDTSTADAGGGPGAASGLVGLGTIEPVSAVASVARLLLEHFTSGSVEPGTRLPAERQLAAQLGVGRSAVREALAALEILGIVSVRPGSGTYLKGSSSELLPQTLSWGVMLGRPHTRELIEVRHALEVQVARLAAENATDQQRAALAETVAQMAGQMGNFEEFVSADMRFHQLLGEASANSLLADLLTSVRSLLRVWVERAVRDAEHTEITLREHRAIAEAVSARQVRAAGEAMDVHMTSARDRLLAFLDATDRSDGGAP